MRHLLRRIARYSVDPFLALLALPVAALSRFIRAFGVEHLPLTRRAFELMGAFPLRRHYYEPLIHPGDLIAPLDRPRDLPGLDLRMEAQLSLLDSLPYAQELLAIPTQDPGTESFYYDNGVFESGDAELWYGMIRHQRPAMILEVGSGMSTLMATEAIRANKREDPAYGCRHLCIEPFESPWLERAGVEVIRERVERVDPSLFQELHPGDILFIDSSHVIRPQGDVLFLYLQILPRLRDGVVVHIHDIFTPRDYKPAWIVEKKRFWNEQYLVEAILSAGGSWEVLLAVNFLAHEAPEALSRAAPVFARQRAFREPGSLYLKKG